MSHRIEYYDCGIHVYSQCRCWSPQKTKITTIHKCVICREEQQTILEKWSDDLAKKYEPPSIELYPKVVRHIEREFDHVAFYVKDVEKPGSADAIMPDGTKPVSGSPMRCGTCGVWLRQPIITERR